jgi:putative restriction endonuclease
MTGYLGVTDFTWFSFLRERRANEVNFWQPSGGRSFRTIPPGAPFFFKLKTPYNAIGGFGFFAHHSVLPAWLAWETFGDANGAPTLDAMCRSIERLRRTPATGRPGSYDIGCIIVADCTFFAEADWVRLPADFAKNIVQGKTYDLTFGEGERVWRECLDRVNAVQPGSAITLDAIASTDRYGKPMIIQPRLGQGAFRIAVLDAYGRACAVSHEHSLPVLEAAHIRDYAHGGDHRIKNGICLRSDIHRLFDAGYVTLDEHRRFVVSDRLRKDYANGKVYYALNGSALSLPANPAHWPDESELAWHRDRFIA